jgi:hypothetical protein
MTWLTATLAALAIYRAARMVAEEDGPAFVFKRLRDAHTDQHSSIALGLRCCVLHQLLVRATRDCAAVRGRRLGCVAVAGVVVWPGGRGGKDL